MNSEKIVTKIMALLIVWLAKKLNNCQQCQYDYLINKNQNFMWCKT